MMNTPPTQLQGSASGIPLEDFPKDELRLLIVEDDADVAAGVASAFQNDGCVVEVVHSAEAALQRLPERESDVVVLDVWLPGIDGFEFIRRIRAAGSEVPILCLTARATVDDRVRGLAIGADDYLVKPFMIPELVARVRALARRAQARAGKRISFGALELDCAARRAFVRGRILPITDRDWKVLSLLVTNGGKTVAKQAILDALAEDGEPSSVHAVEINISRLRAKLEPAGVKIRAVRGYGYLLLEPASA